MRVGFSYLGHRYDGSCISKCKHSCLWARFCNETNLLQALVEYDGVEWHRREWISIYKDSPFQLFLVEHSLVWTDRVDPLSPNNGHTVLWPALVSTLLYFYTDSFIPKNVR